MGIPTEVTWDIQPHTLAKHEILRRYLDAWFPILGSRHRRIIYIDGFCGPGRYKGGEQGSPIIALRSAYSHWERGRLKNAEVVFLFIDIDERRIDNLEREISALPFGIPSNFKIHAIAGLFGDVMGDILGRLEQDHSHIAPTFAFVDPFGFKGIPFDVIERLLRHPHTEVFINLMTDSINRWIEHPNEKVRRHINQLFCIDAASEILSIISRQVLPVAKRKRQVRLLYQSCLRKVAKYVRFFEMRDRRDRPVYHLFFASNNPLGFVKMKEAFWKVDEESGFVFSDATDPNQPKLFSSDPSPSLAREIIERYRGRKHIEAEEIKRFFTEHPDSDYIGKHCSEALKLLEDENSIHPLPVKENGSKRRKHTFPKGTLIDFD